MRGTIPGTEIITTYGNAYQVSQVSGSIIEHTHWEVIHDRFMATLEDRNSVFRRKIEKTCNEPFFSCEDLLFMDIETTGLAHTPLFLIGCLNCTNTNFILSQFLARDFSEEKAVIFLFQKHVEGKRVIVSFNGTRFDFPYIEKRAILNGILFPSDIPHLDLVLACRRHWGDYLPDCKLSTIEKYICGRIRHDDIPGSEIPGAYLHFIETRDPLQITRIIKHNALDLLTMVEIAVKMSYL